MAPKKSASKFWIKNTDGQPSMSATFAVVSFVVTTFAYVASIFEKIGPLNVRPFDAAACTAYMVPLLGLYFGRRWSDGKSQQTQQATDGSTSGE